jgi:putative ABC transport system permease protein
MVAAISPEVMIRGAQVVREYRSRNESVRAVYPVYGRIRNMTMATGRWLTPEDQAQRLRVAVLGGKLAQRFFGEIPPEGEEIGINGLRFTVVGVLKTKVQISNYNTPDNECVFIPYEVAGLLRDIKYPDFIVWSPVNPLFRAEAMRQVREVLARTHDFVPNDERAVRMLSFNELMKIVDTMSLALRVLLAFIGTLTLAIGGVGLANIMLVSVTQRTREIGVLKSIGATRGSILFQFLLEAMAIVTAGGILGVLCGYAVTAALQTLPLLGPLFEDTSGQGDVRLQVSLFAVLTSTLMLEFVGLVAGILPAVKAARLNPIDALRYE